MMLTLKLFNRNSPLDCQTLTLGTEEDAQVDYWIGNEDHCQVYLKDFSEKGIQAQIQKKGNDYQLMALNPAKSIQINEEVLNLNELYILDINDVIRIDQTLLIIDHVPQSHQKKKTPQKRQSSPAVPNPSPPSRLQTLKNRLQQRKNKAE